MENTSPLVAIKCMTYNHEFYISQCLDGFIMQKTDFPFIAVVHDDASTDKTASIILEYAKKYPNIIKPIFETENQYSKHDGSLTRIFDSALPSGVKYIAICEGDDYWTDPYKLQKQYEFLESNADYNLVFSPVKYYSQSKGKFLCVAGGKADSFEDLLKRNTIPTLTTFFRKEIQTQYYEEIHPESKNWLMGDYPMWLYFATKGKIGFISEPMGVYRVLESSLSHSKSPYKRLEFDINRLEIADFFSKYFQVPSVYINSQKIFLQWEYSCRVRDKKAVRDKIQELKKYSDMNHLKYRLIKYSYMCPCCFIALLDGYRRLKGILGDIKSKNC